MEREGRRYGGKDAKSLFYFRAPETEKHPSARIELRLEAGLLRDTRVWTDSSPRWQTGFDQGTLVKITNRVLLQFFRLFVQPLARARGLDATLTSSNFRLHEWLPEATAGKLLAFARRPAELPLSAIKEQRWQAFLRSARRASTGLWSDALVRWLRAKRWRRPVAEELGRQFRVSIEGVKPPRVSKKPYTPPSIRTTTLPDRRGKGLKPIQFMGSLREQDIDLGITVARNNAWRLVRDARALLRLRRFPTAAAVAVLAMEELAKVSLLKRFKGVTDTGALKTLWIAYRNHAAKGASLAAQVENSIMFSSDPAVVFGKKPPTLENMTHFFLYEKADPISEIVDAEHADQLDQLKQLGLYTDCFTERRWTSPSRAITSKVATALTNRAHLLVKSSRKMERMLRDGAATKGAVAPLPPSRPRRKPPETRGS